MPVALSLHGAAIYLFLYLPIILLVFFSFNKNPSGTFPVTGLTLDWYRQLGNDYFMLTSFKTSLIVALITVPVATFAGTLCAFGLVRTEFRFKSLASSFLLMPMVVPGILLVFTISLDTFGVTFFTIGNASTLPMYIWAQVEMGIRPTVNALGTLFIVGSIAILLIAHLLLRR
jgi:ABC-type spermidine/putrescine transport system permease subunit II